MSKEPTFDPDAFAAFAPAPDSPAATADAEVRAATRKRAGLDAPFDPDAFAAYAPKEEEPFNPDAFAAYAPAPEKPGMIESAWKGAQGLVEGAIGAGVRGVKTFAADRYARQKAEAVEQMDAALAGDVDRMNSETFAMIHGGTFSEPKFTRQTAANAWLKRYQEADAAERDWREGTPERVNAGIVTSFKQGGVGDALAATAETTLEQIPNAARMVGMGLIPGAQGKAGAALMSGVMGDEASGDVVAQALGAQVAKEAAAGRAPTTADALAGAMRLAKTGGTVETEAKLAAIANAGVGATLPVSGMIGEKAGEAVAKSIAQEGAKRTTASVATQLATAGAVEGTGAAAAYALQKAGSGQGINPDELAEQFMAEALGGAAFNLMEAKAGVNNDDARRASEAVNLARAKAKQAAATPAAPAEAVATAPAPVDATAPVPAAPPKGERKLEPSAFVEDDAVVDEVAPVAAPVAPVETDAAPVEVAPVAVEVAPMDVAPAEPAPAPRATPGELALGAEADAFALTPESVRDEAPALEARVAAAEAKAAEPVLPGMEEAPVKRTPEQVAADADMTPDELLAQQAAAQAEADAAAEAGDVRAHEQAVGVVSNRVEAIYDPERVLTAEQWVDGIPKSWRGEDGAPDFTKLDGGKMPASGASSALMHALNFKEFAAQAEAELDHRARAEALAEAKEMTGDTLADVLRTGQVKLPSIDRLRGRDTKGEFNQLRRDFDGRWSGLVDSRITLQDTLGQLNALGFGFESEADLVEALKRTAEGKDVYAAHIEYDKAADHPGDIGNPDIQPDGTAKVPAQVPGDRLAAKTQGADYDPTGGAAMAAVDTVSAVSVQGMATMLAGADVKLVVKHMAARGMFVASALGREIRLNVELMKGNIAELARVLAHEIGHLDDYLPTETLARGNVGGRLLSIKNHLKQVFPIDGVTYDNAELQATLKELREGARLKAEAMQGYPRPKVKKGMSDAEVAQTKALAKEWDAVARAIYAQDADAALPPEGFARAAAVHQELLAWSKKLKPWDEAGASPEYNKYRRSSKELYADAISGILVFPEAFAAEAPLFFRAFFRNLDAKSQVAVEFAKMQQFMRDPDAMYAEQADIQTNDFNQGGDIYLARIAEEDAAKKLVINSVKHIWEAIQQAKSWKDVKENVIKPVASEVNTRLIIPLRQNFTDRAAGLATTKTKLDIGDGNYWSGKVYAYSARMRDQVVNVLAEGGVDLNVFDRYMGLKRIAEGDRSEEVNRFLQRGEDAAQAIIALRKGMTPDQLTALNKAEVGYRANMRAVLADMVESGMIAPSQVAQWRAEGGDAYVPFASLKHFEGYVGAGFKAVVGDAGGHVGVTLTGLLKMMNMVRAAEFNKQFKALLEGAREGGIPIVKATGQATGAGRIVFDAPKPGWALVEVWTNGAREGWYYPKEFQPAFTPVVPLAYSVEAQILKGIFKSTWNKAWIDLNLKFMAFTAPVRDMQVMTFAVPGGWRPAMEIARGMALRALEVGAATLNDVALRPFTDYELTIPDKLLSDTDRAVRDAHNGKRNIVADAMIEHGGLTPPQHLFDETEIDNAITMANEKNGSNSEAVLAFMRRQKLITDPETQVGAVRRALRGIIKELEKTVQYSETTAKVAAYRHLVERQGMDPKTAAQFVRHHVGIPSTMENGRVMRFVGAFLPFANVAVAGIKADANIMFKGAPEFVGKGKGFESAAKVRAQFWMKFAGSVGVYSVLCGAARSGLLGEEMEEWWARVPELDMRTGIIIPVGQSIGTDGRRKSDYIKVPMPPGYAWLASGFRESGRAFEKDRTAAEGLRVVFGSMLDTLPSIDPTIASMAITGQYIAGNNPNDPRTGRPILSQAEQDARLKDSSAANLKIIQSILAQTGLYAPKKDKGAPDPEFASWQWLSEAFAARSVFKSQHYGEDERLRHDVALDKAEDAALWSHLPDRLKSLKTEASLAQESRKLLEENVMKAWAEGRAPVRADAEALARGRVSMDFLKQWNRLAPELKELNRKDKAAARQVVGKVEEVAAPYYPGSEQRLALEKMLADRLMRKWEPYDESP